MTQREPLSWRPKLLAFKAAKDLHDYQLIKADLAFANSCFQLISRRKYGVISSGSHYSKKNRSNFNHWCTFIAGGIYYRRCFTSGARCRLSRDDLVTLLADNLLLLHDTLISIVDKHIAHSVNELELGCTTLEVAVDSKGRLHRGGIGWRGSGIGPLGPKGYRAICQLISTIDEGVVDHKIALLTKTVRDRIDRMSDDAILQLSEGFPPNIDAPEYGRARRWPKPSE